MRRIIHILPQLRHMRHIMKIRQRLVLPWQGFQLEAALDCFFSSQAPQYLSCGSLVVLIPVLCQIVCQLSVPLLVAPSEFSNFFISSVLSPKFCTLPSLSTYGMRYSILVSMKSLSAVRALPFPRWLKECRCPLAITHFVESLRRITEGMSLSRSNLGLLRNMSKLLRRFPGIGRTLLALPSGIFSEVSLRLFFVHSS